MSGSRTANRPPLAGDPREDSVVGEKDGKDAAPDVSVIVPVTERPEALSEIYSEYSAALGERGLSYEFLFVIEPWGEEVARPLQVLVGAGEPVRILRMHRPVGEAGQLKIASGHCRAEIVITLPAYHRVRSECLAGLVKRLEGGADLAVAWRSPRRDSWINRLQNRVFHYLVGLTTTRAFHDIGCGVRAMRRSLLEEVPLYGDFSRFLPLLAVQEGYEVVEVPCPQHPGDRQPRLYGPGIYLRRLIDLFGVFFLMRFTYKPLRFFGLIGSGLSLVGALILVTLFVQRVGGQAIADRPLLLLGVLLFSLGVQVVALGLVGELIVHLHAPSRLRYRVRDGRREKAPV